MTAPDSLNASLHPSLNAALNPWQGTLALPSFAQQQAAATLFGLLKQHSFKRGHFVLASGKHSTWYLDCRTTAMLSEGAYQIGRALQPAVAALGADSVGGMAVGAVPLVSAVLHHSAMVGQGLKGFFVRKEAKAYGRTQQIEGHLAPYMRVVLLEDVVTSGGSTLKAVQAIEAAHPSVQVVGIISLVDRQAGGAERFAAKGLAYHYLYSVQAFLAE